MIKIVTGPKSIFVFLPDGRGYEIWRGENYSGVRDVIEPPEGEEYHQIDTSEIADTGEPVFFA